MADNSLSPGQPRIGWFGDGLPGDVTPDTATMLGDDGEQIILTLPWLPTAPTGQIARWFHGDSTHFGDDPDRSRYSYQPPEELTFVDPRGSVVLVGCQSLGFTSAMFGVGEGRIHVRAAVLGARRLGYSTVHGMRTEIPGLGGWFGLSSVEEEITADEEGRTQSFSLHAGAPESVRLGRRLNLQVQPRWEVSRKAGAHEVHDRVFLETQVQSPRRWEEHLQVHASVRDLLDIATWRPTGYRSILVNRRDDPIRDSSGADHGARWCEVRTHAIRQQDEPVNAITGLYRFEHVQATGHARWVRLRQRFGRGVAPLLNLLDMKPARLESQLIQSCIGLEAIAYQMAIEAGANEKQAKNEPIVSRFGRIRGSLPFVIVDDGWPQRAADGYNGVKHANRPLPDLLTMRNLLRENILVFRLWAADRIGVPTDVLNQTIWRDADMQLLLRQGVTRAPV